MQNKWIYWPGPLAVSDLSIIKCWVIKLTIIMRQGKSWAIAQYKEEFPWLKEVDSLALANAQLHLQVAYRNFFRSPKSGFPKFKSKHRHQDSYTTNNQRGSIRIEHGRIKLPRIGFVKLKQHRPIPENFCIKSATVSKTPTGKYFVSVLFEGSDPASKGKECCRTGFFNERAICFFWWSDCSISPLLSSKYGAVKQGTEKVV